MKQLLLSAAVVSGSVFSGAAAGPYRGHYRSAYSSGYGTPSAYINGGYFTPFGYQPYSMTITPTYGGAVLSGQRRHDRPGVLQPVHRRRIRARLRLRLGLGRRVLRRGGGWEPK